MSMFPMHLSDNITMSLDWVNWNYFRNLILCITICIIELQLWIAWYEENSFVNEDFSYLIVSPLWNSKIRIFRFESMNAV